MKKGLTTTIVLLFLISTSCFAACKAKIHYYDQSGNHVATIHLNTYRHGFLYHNCSVIPQHEKYLKDTLLQKRLCNQLIPGCCKNESCRTRVIFRKSWPFFGHHL